MSFLASLIAYLGAVTGIVRALLMPLCVVLSAPSQSTVPHQTVAMALKPSEAAATTNVTTKVTFRIGQRERRVAPSLLEGGAFLQIIKSAAYARRRVQTANETSRKQSLHTLDRLERMRHLAYQQEPNFASRYMGYVDDPSADRSLVR
jgi:hypothetical protein